MEAKGLHIIPQSKGVERKQRGPKKLFLRDFHVYGLVELDQLTKDNERKHSERTKPEAKGRKTAFRKNVFSKVKTERVSMTPAMQG